MTKIRNRFKLLLAKKELRDGRNYTYEDISGATGLSTTTITSYAKGRVSRYDEKTLVALCDWLDCNLEDLLEYPPERGQQDAQTRMPAVATG